jgi:C-terminal processing protease CtpA/Prc
MYLKPNSYYGPPFRYDRSGFQIQAKPSRLNQFIVTGVLEHSPANDAGVRVGDMIVEIDGIKTESLSLSDVMYSFVDGPCSRKLVAERSGVISTLAFTLRDIL